MEDQNTLVSIIVPAFNVDAWLCRCLDSAIEQSYSNLEIIVIDDGSTDSTYSIIEKYARDDFRIKKIHQENRGLSAVRNRGIQIAQGTILLFLDSDDWLHQDAVSEILNLFERYDLDLVLYQCAKYYDCNNSWSSGSDDFYWNMISGKMSSQSVANEVPEMLALYPLAQLKVLSRSFISRHNLSFIEGLRYEDNPLHVQIYSLNPKVAFLKKKLYAWRQGRPGQITANPHVADCRIVIGEMLLIGSRFDSDKLPYLVVAMTRLVASTARLITTEDERLRFLMEFRHIIIDSLGIDRISDVIKSTSQSLLTHPGDLILIQCLFAHTSVLNKTLGSGIGRYAGALSGLLRSNVPSNYWSVFGKIAFAATNGKLLYNFGRGTGESAVGRIADTG